MVTIIIFGNLEDKKLTNLLINNLEGRYNIFYYSLNKIISYMVKDSNKDILIIESSSINFIDSSNSIVIFKNNIKNIINLNIESKTNIIVFSQNINAIKFLNKSKLKNIITFGYKSTDTLTSSSFDGEKKTICLQRQIYNIYGEPIEPFEFTVNDDNDILTLLPIYGVKILLGDY